MDGLRAGCVVMAAGNAARFGDNKLLARLEGRSLIERALAAAAEPELSQVAVVSQYPGIEELARAWGYLALHNPRPNLGLSYTIRLGVEALAGCDAVLLLPADQPLLSCESVGRIVRRWRAEPERIVAAGHGGARGSPYLFPKEFFGELLSLRGERGGGETARAHEDRLSIVELPAGELAEVDTPQTLRALRARRRR